MREFEFSCLVSLWQKRECVGGTHAAGSMHPPHTYTLAGMTPETAEVVVQICKIYMLWFYDAANDADL